MAFKTYSDLKTKVAGYLSRTDLSSQIDDAIALFESEFNANQRIKKAEQETTLTTTAGQKKVSLPDDFEALSLVEWADGTSEITNVTRDALKQYYTGANGRPIACAISPSNSISFAPIPDGSYEVDVIYYARLNGLTIENSTNWLIDKYPHIYLTGVLYYMLEYVQDEDRATRIAALHTSNITKLERSSDNENYTSIVTTEMP